MAQSEFVLTMRKRWFYWPIFQLSIAAIMLDLVTPDQAATWIVKNAVRCELKKPR